MAQSQANDGGKKKGGVWRVVFVVSLIVLIGCLVALGAIWFSYFQGQQKYNKVADMAGLDPSAGMSELTVDWAALLAANPDTVGWVYIPNTPISYPIVRGADNDYYLSHDFDGAEGWLTENGCVFMDYRNDPEWKDPSTFVYGHHLNDGSMFAALGEIHDQARFEECRTVFLLTPQGNYKLRGYSLVHCAGTEALVRTTFDSSEEMAAYVQEMIDRSEFDPGEIPKASEITKSFAFATCDNTYQSSGRYVLFCYVEDTTVSDLGGQIGIASDDQGGTVGFTNEVLVDGAQPEGETK